MKNVAILGASGYTGQELCRVLKNHPSMQAALVMTSRPKSVPEAPALPYDLHLDPLDLGQVASMDGAFLCTPHGAGVALVQAIAESIWAKGIELKIVDLSADFRLKDPQVYQQTYDLQHAAPELLAQAVYGLTELQREAIQQTKLVANPGCYPTSILLPLLPLLQQGLIAADSPIIADSKSGVSGAGKSPKERSIYGNVAENFLAYGVGNHRHTPEIHQEAGTDRIVFTPHLLPMFRGMLSTIYLTPAKGVSAEQMRSYLQEKYAQEPFVRIYERGQPELNRVQLSNYCDIAVTDNQGQVVITSAIDNLGKGAATQAIQNMNLMLGLEETVGLL